MLFERWLSIFRQPEHCLVVLGLDAAGKTSLIHHLMAGHTVDLKVLENPYNSYLPGLYSTKYSGNWHILKLDPGGCGPMLPLAFSHIQHRSGILWVHDCSDLDRRAESVEAFQTCLRLFQVKNPPFVWVLLNKLDLVPENEREAKVARLREEFEAIMAPYTSQFEAQVKDMPRLNAHSGDQVPALKQAIEEKLNIPVKNRTQAQLALQAPTREILLQRVQEANDAAIASDEFWASFTSATINKWDHYTHLRAGYMVMLESAARGTGMLSCADYFLTHVVRLREANPVKFSRAPHYTMTVFWLTQLRAAAVAYQVDHDSSSLPGPDDFGQVLLHSPELMDSNIWRDHYSKELLFGQEARDGWCIPDLKPLPVIKVHSRKDLSHDSLDRDPYRLMRFGFTVVQKVISSHRRRGLIVRTALEMLQTSTIRLRATNQKYPPYSETQAYFWIQVAHAALRSLEVQSEAASQGAATTVSFSAFIVAFDLSPETWKQYYSENIWESIEARTEFVRPDLRGLPNAIIINGRDNSGLAQPNTSESMSRYLLEPCELPTQEELALLTALILDEVREMAEPEPKPEDTGASHAALLLFLYQRISSLIGDDERTLEESLSRSSEVETDLAVQGGLGATQGMFWVQQVSTAFTSMDTVPASFKEFIEAQTHLSFHDLPLLIYTQETWSSKEAKLGVAAPDVRAPTLEKY